MKYTILLTVILIALLAFYIYKRKAVRPVQLNPHCSAVNGPNGTTKFCTGVENGTAYCYGNSKDCVWTGNCANDMDCALFAQGAPNNQASLKFTDNKKCSDNPNPNTWQGNACQSGTIAPEKPMTNPYCAFIAPDATKPQNTVGMCVGTENGSPVCYGYTTGCNWSGQCTKDSDCAQYAVGQPGNNQKFINPSTYCVGAQANPVNWPDFACKAW